MEELIEHDCPVEGLMMIEAGKPCNWCNEVINGTGHDVKKSGGSDCHTDAG